MTKKNKIKIYSAMEVAKLCGVVNQTAINWIKSGYLPAFTTPGGQTTSSVTANNCLIHMEGLAACPFATSTHTHRTCHSGRRMLSAWFVDQFVAVRLRRTVRAYKSHFLKA